RVGQGPGQVVRRPPLPHDPPAVPGLPLAGWLSGRPIRQQVVHRKGSWVRHVRIQRVDQRGPFLNDPNPRVAVTVDPPLVALGQTEPPLQAEIIFDLLELSFPHEQPGEGTDHHPSHWGTDRIVSALTPMYQRLRPP